MDQSEPSTQSRLRDFTQNESALQSALNPKIVTVASNHATVKRFTYANHLGCLKNLIARLELNLVNTLYHVIVMLIPYEALFYHYKGSIFTP